MLVELVHVLQSEWHSIGLEILARTFARSRVGVGVVGLEVAALGDADAVVSGDGVS